PWTSVRSHAAWEGWDEALADFLRLHRLSKVGKARFMDGRMEEFFRDSTRTLAAAGWARLWFLDWDGAAVASFLCLEYGGSVGLYYFGFDPTHPKLVLRPPLAVAPTPRRIPVFDFLRGEEPYKYAFGPEPRELFRMQVRP